MWVTLPIMFLWKDSLGGSIWEPVRNGLPWIILSGFLLFSLLSFFYPHLVFHCTGLLVLPWYVSSWGLIKHLSLQKVLSAYSWLTSSITNLCRNPLLVCKDYLPAGVWFPLGSGTINPAGEVLYWFLEKVKCMCFTFPWEAQGFTPTFWKLSNQEWGWAWGEDEAVYYSLN